MEILPVGVELFHANRRTDRLEPATCISVRNSPLQNKYLENESKESDY